MGVNVKNQFTMGCHQKAPETALKLLVNRCLSNLEGTEKVRNFVPAIV